MENYKPNSHRSKEEPKESIEEKKKIERVVSGKVKVKKKNEVQKLADAFIPEDINNIKSYIFMDVLVPAIKKAISDIGHNCIDAIFPGAAGYIKKATTASKISYRDYYDRDDDRRYDREVISKSRGVGDYDNIVIDNKGEAEEVLFQMEELIKRYGLVRVADLYELVGTSGPYTSNDYGWLDLRSAYVVRVRDGYLLKLPRALPLN